MLENVKSIVDKVLDDECTRTSDGMWKTELYLDYRDVNLDRATINEIAKSDDPRQAFFDLFDYFDGQVWEVQDNLKDQCSEALSAENIIYSEEELENYIRDKVVVDVPDEDFKKRNEVCVNIVVDAGDANYEFTKNNFAHGYYGDGEIEDNSSLLWLATQQGCNKDALMSALEKGTAFTGQMHEVVMRRIAAHKVLEQFGLKYEFGRDRSTGKYAELRSVRYEMDNCKRMLARAQTSIKKVPSTYNEYSAMCVEKGISVKSEEFYNETIAKQNQTINELQQKIADYECQIEEKGLTDVVKAVDEYNVVNAELVELSQTEEYKNCKLIESIIDASSSVCSSINALTFCVKMSLGDYFDLRDAIECEAKLNKSYYPKERKGTGEIELSSGVKTLLFDDWNGSGSLSFIDLKENVSLPINLIHSAYPDGAYGQAVMSVYGTNEAFYTDSLIEIKAMDRGEVEFLLENSGSKDPLDIVIAACESKKQLIDEPNVDIDLDAR